MTAAPADLAGIARASADRVCAVLQDRPFRAGQPYDPRPVVAMAGAELATLRRAVLALDHPLVVDAAGRVDRFGKDLAGLLSFLQMVECLYHGLDTVPPSMAVSAGRNLSQVQVIARKVRDGARRRHAP